MFVLEDSVSLSVRYPAKGLEPFPMLTRIQCVIIRFSARLGRCRGVVMHLPLWCKKESEALMVC